MCDGPAQTRSLSSSIPPDSMVRIEGTFLTRDDGHLDTSREKKRDYSMTGLTESANSMTGLNGTSPPSRGDKRGVSCWLNYEAKASSFILFRDHDLKNVAMKKIVGWGHTPSKQIFEFRGGSGLRVDKSFKAKNQSSVRAGALAEL